MNHYEKGRHVPDIDTLRRMATELNVPLNYFFCDDQTTAELALLISRMTQEDVNLTFATPVFFTVLEDRDRAAILRLSSVLGEGRLSGMQGFCCVVKSDSWKLFVRA